MFILDLETKVACFTIFVYFYSLAISVGPGTPDLVYLLGALFSVTSSSVVTCCLVVCYTL